MPLPADGPTDAQSVKDWLRVQGTDLDDLIDRCVGAANGYARQLPVVVDAVPAIEDWSTRDDIVQGATMLAGRLVRRRNSPGGTEPMGEAGVAYVSRNDPDIAQLLRTGSYAKPAVG